MIKKLSYRISFPSTGKVFSQNIDFEPGLTIVRGPNETGKSLILEMIRYALFGVDALRGDRSDYDTLDVNLIFEIKDESYRVVRSGTKAFLNGKLAVGTAAVNKKIQEILGFDLSVFDIACAAVQGDLDKLTKRMRPGERRKMVEEVIGLNSIEEEEKHCRSEGNALKRLAESQESKLVEPEPPQKPEQYTPSDVLEAAYRQQTLIEAERDQLLKMIEPEMPIQPTKPEYADDVDEHEQRRIDYAIERTSLERTLRAIPRVTRTRQDIERALAFYEQKSLGPRPEYGESELRAWKDAWEVINKVGTLVRCPKCNAEFDPTTSTIHQVPEPPPVSLREVDSQIISHERWRGYEKEPVEHTELSKDEADEQAYALSQEPARNELSSALSSIPDLPDRSEEAERKRVYLRELEIFTRLSEVYGPLKKQWDESRDRLTELPEPDPTLEENLKISSAYEELLRRYEVDKVSFDESKEAVRLLLEESEGYFKGAEALKDVRLEAKQHLVPSLSRVASHLLTEMSDGKRTSIVVDEDFEVTVDGQPVRTLSGSGVSITNLSLRIALGQVLTNRVIPLFLADEIDADCDQERSEAIFKSLKTLTKDLKQIIVVSHKELQGDNNILLD